MASAVHGEILITEVKQILWSGCSWFLEMVNSDGNKRFQRLLRYYNNCSEGEDSRLFLFKQFHFLHSLEPAWFSVVFALNWALSTPILTET